MQSNEFPAKPAQALVCFAMEEEAGAFRKTPQGLEVSILITGIGRHNTEKSLRRILQHQSPQTVFTCGFAGGLNPDLQVGDVLFETTDATLGERLTQAGARRAKFLCSSRIATTVAEKTQLRETTGADAVEMESDANHAICRERGISCATVRAISDSATDPLPLDFNILSKADLSLDYTKLLVAVAKSPGTIPALLRLQKNCKFAADRLALILQKTLSAAASHCPQ